MSCSDECGATSDAIVYASVLPPGAVEFRVEKVELLDPRWTVRIRCGVYAYCEACAEKRVAAYREKEGESDDRAESDG